nr:MAG TPA: hypothetical protein [Caudoviricetes sp.]
MRGIRACAFATLDRNSLPAVVHRGRGLPKCAIPDKTGNSGRNERNRGMILHFLHGKL